MREVAGEAARPREIGRDVLGPPDDEGRRLDVAQARFDGTEVERVSLLPEAPPPCAVPEGVAHRADLGSGCELRVGELLAVRALDRASRDERHDETAGP